MNKVKNTNIEYQSHEEMVNSLTPSVGKTIKKIGLDKYNNTCRLVLDDGSTIFVQSQAGEEYLLKHGLTATFYADGRFSQGDVMSWANVQAQPLAPAGDKLAPSGEAQESAKNPPAQGAGDSCAAAPCSGLAGCVASLHRLWLDWNDVSAINGVNLYGTDVIDCELEIIFKSGKSIKVKLGEMSGIKHLSDCPVAK